MASPNGIPAFEGPEDVLRRRPAAPAPQGPLETSPIPTATRTGTRIPNTPLAASAISFILGGLFFSGISMALAGPYSYWWCTRQLGFFCAAWAAFHWGEFAVTAGWNREKCSVDSFLLENGSMYHIAHGVAVTEYLLSLWFRPGLKSFPYVSTIGVVLVVIGQVLRSGAMIHAATNFSHQVAFRKAESHQLVTDGIYAWSRHPSYAGFFYWALGTQLVLQNSVSFVVYLAILWRFFNLRTKYEEQALVRFFGQDYVRYRERVGTLIPFIR
ncbi:ICMT-domain-containing protein [Phanerochaete sordida]|uniref:Protein-S-isoprenylcysteine O-methyltransferase n=1 Tax=Phanerochaete sordida TaxID=48140 RepID=A0A9P3L6L9_9APHY|nr:ICMT-domain-containing protein [Phanerochaete sordida]